MRGCVMYKLPKLRNLDGPLKPHLRNLVQLGFQSVEKFRWGFNVFETIWVIGTPSENPLKPHLRILVQLRH